LGNAYFQLRRWPQAAQAYREMLTAEPDNSDLLHRLGLALRQSGDADGAVAAFRQAIALDPNDAGKYNNLSIALNSQHDYAAAISVYRQALQLDPQNPDISANLATLYEQTNRLAEAEKSAQLGLEVAPSHTTLRLIAAKCARRADHANDAIPPLEALVTSHLDARMRRAVEFELGRCYDRLKQPDRAFEHFARGNALTTVVWPELKTGARQYMAQLELLLATFTREWIETWSPGAPGNEPAPVFMVGFPRSGTTLLDTMLDAHPEVTVLEERPIIPTIVEAVDRLPQGYPRALEHLNASQVAALRAQYWQAAEREIGSHTTASVLIDKLPLNTADAGLIHRVFPNARFIFSLRHPCDVCLSGLMQEAAGAVYANFTTLEDIAGMYSRIMTLWQRYRSFWPFEAHTVRYEDLVTDTQSVLHDVLAFLNLPWTDELADHTVHARRRGRIYTPSYHQVIRPIYNDAIERWRRYAEHFAPIMPALLPYIAYFGYGE
jgi:tetratricopeptide (TPR) repeat protein